MSLCSSVVLFSFVFVNDNFLSFTVLNYFTFYFNTFNIWSSYFYFFMYEIKVTVEVPGLPEALNALAGALSALPVTSFTQNGANNQQIENAGTVNIGGSTVENPMPPAADPSTTANAEAASVAQTGLVMGSSPSKSYTVDDLSRAGATLIDQGKMPQLLELLKKYGARAVTQLDPGTYPAFVEEMKALGAKL